MGLIMNKVTKCCGYFDSFGRYFKWLHEPLKKIFNEVHQTSHIVQAESSQTCGLQTIYFIVHMMNPKDVTNMTRQVNVGQYVRRHYDTHLKMMTLLNTFQKNSTQTLTCYCNLKENQKQHNNHHLPVNDVSK